MEDESKAYLLEYLKNDPLASYTFHYFENKNTVKAIHLLSMLENLLIEFISDDIKGIDLSELFANEPSREQFSTEEDYLAAKQHHMILKSIFTLESKIKGKVNADELKYVLEYLYSLKASLYSVNSIEGRRIRLMTTKSVDYSLKAKAGRGLMKMLNSESEE